MLCLLAELWHLWPPNVCTLTNVAITDCFHTSNAYVQFRHSIVYSEHACNAKSVPWCNVCLNLWLLSIEREYAIHWLLLCVHLDARYNHYTFCMWHVLLHMAYVEFCHVFSSTGNVRVQHSVTRSDAVSFHILQSKCRLLEVENMTGNESSVRVTVFESCLSHHLLFKNSSPSFLQSRCMWHESFNRNNGRNLSSVFDYCDVSFFHIKYSS